MRTGNAPLYRNKITITPAGKSPCKFFEAGTKRRLTDDEVAELPWRDLELNVMCKVTSLFGQRRAMGRFLHPRGHHGEALR